MDKIFKSFLLNSYINKTFQWRCCSNNIIDKVPEAPSATYSSTSNDYKKGKKFAVARLEELFQIHHTKAIEIAMRFKKIHKVMNKVLSENYHVLKSYNIDDEIILEYLDLLAENNIEDKLKFLKQLPFKLNDTAPLLLLTYKDFIFLVKRELDGEARLSFFCNKFNIPVLEVCEAFIKRQFLFKISLTKMEKNIETLLDNGISLEEIRKDYWVLQYKYDIIKERIEIAKKRNIGKIKTWMVRSPISVLDRYCQRRSENKLILGDGTLTEYLSHRLECGVEAAKIILFKHPALSNKHMKKIKEIIDFLLGYGFTPLHIVKNPKILLHSVETTAKRLKQLESEGLKLDTLYILTKSQKQYLTYYENLVKANKNKIKETA
ncbi:hypothetical protein FQR65_LT04586 [Abscondita terminalis]|nr:hypothetical protein FQR65_LT04586 [Abscondita terminalis]